MIFNKSERPDNRLVSFALSLLRCAPCLKEVGSGLGTGSIMHPGLNRQQETRHTLQILPNVPATPPTLERLRLGHQPHFMVPGGPGGAQATGSVVQHAQEGAALCPPAPAPDTVSSASLRPNRPVGPRSTDPSCTRSCC